MKKSIISIFIIFLFTSINAFAKKSDSISIQIIQNNPGQDKIWATSEFFEQSVINYFFDSGNIVSNSPIYIKDSSSKKNESALKDALCENNEGGMDYLVRIELFFKNSKSVAPDVPKLGNIEKVSWKVYKVLTGIEINAGEGQPGKITSSNDNELGIESFAYVIARNLSSSFNK